MLFGICNHKRPCMPYWIRSWLKTDIVSSLLPVSASAQKAFDEFCVVQRINP